VLESGLEFLTVRGFYTHFWSQITGRQVKAKSEKRRSRPSGASWDQEESKGSDSRILVWVSLLAFTFSLSIQDEITSLFGFEKLRCNERCYSGNREVIPSQVLMMSIARAW
jgi:hypothetical protein